MPTMTPPNVVRPGIKDLWKFLKLGRALTRLGTRIGDVTEILTGAARPILDRWFKSEELKMTLATDAIIGTMASPSMPGTAYVLLHHIMEETNGKRGVRGYVQGGVGSLTKVLAQVARDLSVTIGCQAEVREILVKQGAVYSVELENGDEFHAPVFASHADAHVTFTRLLDPKLLPDDFVEAVPRIDHSSASLKINLALSELPRFLACPGTEPGLPHRGTIHICSALDYIERAYDDAKYGRPSERPILECTIPSGSRSLRCPPRSHLMSMFIQYALYKLRAATWDQLRETYADRCVDLLTEYAPNSKRSIIARQVLTPIDLERIFNLTGGNIFHGAMSLNQLFCFRPVPGLADYRTPIRSLYLCGAAAHPGG